MRRFARFALLALETLIVTGLILAPRCLNRQEVFVAGNVYFTDADCYARMTRVRLCARDPGFVVRHHDFENFPQGTTPHTTAPLDYLILGLSILLKHFTAHAIELAGAFISPMLALLTGLFLWWWSRRMTFRYRWAMLILYAISPILVHGTEMGRPDHQSLLILLVTIAICSEWSLQTGENETPATMARWSAASGGAWGLAIWVSAYEPLLLLVLILLLGFLQNRHLLFTRHRRITWIVFASLIALALLIERRIPASPIFQPAPIFKNWSRMIGELTSVSPLDPVWFQWAGYLIAIAPLLVWIGFRNNKTANWRLPLFVVVLLAATYLLTIWQARWAYFFLLIFVIALPALLEPIKSRAAVWIAFALSIVPILQVWDERLWPNESEIARRAERRLEAIELRELALHLMSSERHPFVAPWWLSPALAYWSGQPGIAGSSHESLEGIVETARFFLTEDMEKPREILENHRVGWVVAYDAERVAENSASILQLPIPGRPLCRVIDRTPAQAPPYLVLFTQTGGEKLFKVVNKW